MKQIGFVWMILCLTVLSWAREPDGPIAEDLDHKALAEIKEMSTGLALVLFEKGKPTLVKGYGYADLANGEKVTGDTAFNIGSISKTVAAWGVMLLVQEGKVELDAPVSKYVSFPLPKTDFDNDGVTIRRLLSHTAGLSVHGYPGYWPGEPRPSTKDSLAGKTEGRGATARVETIMEPGSKWKYSGGGYTLLQLMIEEQSGMPFHQYMENRVLKPLGMNHSSFALPQRVKERMAVAYGHFADPIPLRMFTAQAAASFKTTANDFSKFTRASILKEAGGSGGGGVLTEATLRSMYVHPPNSPSHTLGYQTWEQGKEIQVGHGGDNDGWHALFLVRPYLGEGLIIFTNSNQGPALRSGLACAWKNHLSGGDRDCFRPNVFFQLSKVFSKKGVEALIAHYHDMKKANPKDNAFNEGLLNRMGYALMQSGKLDPAVKIFELNVAEYPKASNPYDSLGEGYMNQKRYELAIKNYKKSVELDPTNTNATRMIERIKKAM